MHTFIVGSRIHTLSHLLWKWNDEERKIGERGWGWEE